MERVCMSPDFPLRDNENGGSIRGVPAVGDAFFPSPSLFEGLRSPKTALASSLAQQSTFARSPAFDPHRHCIPDMEARRPKTYNAPVVLLNILPVEKTAGVCNSGEKTIHPHHVRITVNVKNPVAALRYVGAHHIRYPVRHLYPHELRDPYTRISDIV
jgi:hypothetical protein